MIECKICHNLYKQITTKHVKYCHDIDLITYKQLYPEAILQSIEAKRFAQDNHFYGKQHAEATKLLMTKKHAGKVLKKETIEKLRAYTTKHNPMYKEEHRITVSIKVKHMWDNIDLDNKKRRFENMARTCINKGLWTPKELKRKFDVYRDEARRLTEESYRTYFYNIENAHLRGKGYDLDHKVSLFDGFKHSVPLNIISHYKNLQVITKHNNQLKSRKSDISVQQLMESIGG